MTAIARDADRIRELDEDVSEAWRVYSERLRDLSGAEYENAEGQCWGELQRELRRLERRRQLLMGTTA